MQYEYRHTQPVLQECESDGDPFTLIHSMKAAPISHCPSCGRPIERVISVPLRPIGGDTPVHHT